MALTAAPRIELLGGFRVMVQGQPRTRLPSARQQQILAFLILHARGGPIQRQRIAGTLWPDSTDVQALTNLRRELHHVREDWPALEALVDAGTRTIAWHPDAGATVDLIGRAIVELPEGRWRRCGSSVEFRPACRVQPQDRRKRRNPAIALGAKC